MGILPSTIIVNNAMEIGQETVRLDASFFAAGGQATSIEKAVRRASPWVTTITTIRQASTVSTGVSKVTGSRICLGLFLTQDWCHVHLLFAGKVHAIQELPRYGNEPNVAEHSTVEAEGYKHR